LSDAPEIDAMADARGDPSRFTWILDDLAVGGAVPQAAATGLARAGIGAVIDVTPDERGAAEAFAAGGLDFLHLPTADLCAVRQDMLDRGVAFARRAARRRRKLLIHCEHGIGRAPLVALCILVDRGLSPLAALSVAKAARERVSPSPAQYEAWAAWMRRCRPAEAVPGFEAFAAIAYRHLPRSA
jgi:Dual specificity phosphatase, catalytic domain